MAVVGATENLPSGRCGQARGHRHGRQRQDDRGQQHRRRGPAGAGRLPVPRRLAQGAERIVDLATLTGAVIVALGSTYAGLMSNDEELAERITAAGEQTRRDRLAPAAARGVRRADQGHLRRSRQRARSSQGGHDHRRARSCRTSSPTRPGRTWTSPARPGISGAPTRPRAPPATACACWSSWRAPTAPSPRAARRSATAVRRRSARSPADGLRPLPRSRADQAHGARVRRGRGRAGGRGARPHEVLPL